MKQLVLALLSLLVCQIAFAQEAPKHDVAMEIYLAQEPLYKYNRGFTNYSPAKEYFDSTKMVWLQPSVYQQEQQMAGCEIDVLFSQETMDSTQLDWWKKQFVSYIEQSLEGKKGIYDLTEFSVLNYSITEELGLQPGIAGIVYPETGIDFETIWDFDYETGDEIETQVEVLNVANSHPSYAHWFFANSFANPASADRVEELIYPKQEVYTFDEETFEETVVEIQLDFTTDDIVSFWVRYQLEWNPLLQKMEMSIKAIYPVLIDYIEGDYGQNYIPFAFGYTSFAIATNLGTFPERLQFIESAVYSDNRRKIRYNTVGPYPVYDAYFTQVQADLLLARAGKPIEPKVKLYSENYPKTEIQSWSVGMKKGNPHGEFKRSYPDGKLCEKGLFKKGVMTGPWIRYNARGIEIAKLLYLDNQLEGQQELFHHNGKKKETFIAVIGVLNGAYSRWYENGQLMEEGQYVNGKRKGAWAFYSEDGLVKVTKSY